MSVQLIAPGVLLLMRVIVVFTGMLSIVDSSGLQLPSEVFQLLPQLVKLTVLSANQELFLSFESLE